MNFLSAILEQKRLEVARRKGDIPERLLREKPFFGRTPLSLSAALRGKSPAVVAEVKKASPSRGIIRADFDPAAIAREYEMAGASAISVLTDEEFFQGSLEHLEAVRRHVALPLLRKDFIFDEYQLCEAKAAGADAVLLIVGALEPDRLIALHAESEMLGMECLVEVHTESELDSIVGLGCSLVGINNRDLVTFETDTGVSARLGRRVPRGAVCISESGISGIEDLLLLSRAGIHAVLVGESFMRAASPGRALAAFLASARGAG